MWECTHRVRLKVRKILFYYNLFFLFNLVKLIFTYLYVIFIYTHLYEFLSITMWPLNSVHALYG